MRLLHAHRSVLCRSSDQKFNREKIIIIGLYKLKTFSSLVFIIIELYKLTTFSSLVLYYYLTL